MPNASEESVKWALRNDHWGEPSEVTNALEKVPFRSDRGESVWSRFGSEWHGIP